LCLAVEKKPRSFEKRKVRIASHQKFAIKLTNKIRETLRQKLHFEKVHVEEILQQAEGYGIVTLVIRKETKLAGLILSETGFGDKDFDAC